MWTIIAQQTPIGMQYAVKSDKGLIIGMPDLETAELIKNSVNDKLLLFSKGHKIYDNLIGIDIPPIQLVLDFGGE